MNILCQNLNLTHYNNAFADVSDFPSLQESQKKIDELHQEMKQHLVDVKRALKNKLAEKQ